MKKQVVLLLVLALIAPALPASSAYSTADSYVYLAVHANNPWSVMALTASGKTVSDTAFLKNVSGKSAIDYAAPILAITALNQDPRTYGGSDYVAVLKSYATGGQIGDASTLNDDIFGILALVSAGVSVSDKTLSDSKKFLLDHQNGDGGWGFVTSSASDTNMTSGAILALLGVGVPATDIHIASAENYLKSAQNDDGGFPYDPKSGYGTASDTSSTAWVTWALNALNISASTWEKNTKSPLDFLQSAQSSGGYFEYQKGSGEDAFTPVTTAYAVIALSGKTLPLKILSVKSEEFEVRIEGSGEQICSTKAPGPTALDAVKNASAKCNFTYHVTDTSFGPYLDKIGSDQAAGMTGWMYLVNDAAPDVGAGDYQLKTSDKVLWYYGDFGWQPMRISLSASEITQGGQAVVSAEGLKNGHWDPVEGAEVHYGALTAKTDSSGSAVIKPVDGYYRIFAEKNGYVRTENAMLKVGQPAAVGVSLSATLDNGDVLGEKTHEPTENSISFSIEPGALDFGTLVPGSSSQKTLKLKNGGTSTIKVAAVVAGEELFVDFLQVNSERWQNFSVSAPQAQTSDLILKLNVPVGYKGVSGTKAGQITFWAMTE